MSLRIYEGFIHNLRDQTPLQLCLSLVKDGLGYTVMPYCAIHEFPQMHELSATYIKGLFITWSL